MRIVRERPRRGVLEAPKGEQPMLPPAGPPPAAARRRGCRGCGRKDLARIITSEPEPEFAADLRERYPQEQRDAE
jgi:hypothetical protein